MAYMQARKHKQYRSCILKFSRSLEENILLLQSDLYTDNYTHGTYREFIVHDSKKRTIKAAPFRDRVVHHAVCNVIEPLFERTFMYDSYACRKGKGTHSAIKRLRCFIQSLTTKIRGESEEKIFCLKCDIKKYFDSVDHTILLSLLSKQINNIRVMKVCEIIIRSVPFGIPIGNLTSQLFANIYLNELDQYIKRVLREKYYIRYMDDFIILGTDRKKLEHIKERIRSFLYTTLKLILHPNKSTVFSLMPNGIDFLGYRVFTHHIELRRSTVRRWKKKFKKLPPESQQEAIRNWRGYTKHAWSWRTVKIMVEPKTLLI